MLDECEGRTIIIVTFKHLFFLTFHRMTRVFMITMIIIYNNQSFIVHAHRVDCIISTLKMCTSRRSEYREIADGQMRLFYFFFGKFFSSFANGLHTRSSLSLFMHIILLPQRGFRLYICIILFDTFFSFNIMFKYLNITSLFSRHIATIDNHFLISFFKGGIFKIQN